MKNTSYISIGSNIGNKIKNLSDAIEHLENNEKIIITQMSSVYLTEPKYFTKQDDFFNMVLSLSTDLEPLDLLCYTQFIENKMGREKSLYKNRPRIIDLDILTFNNVEIKHADLVIPHPFIAERRFILEPFNEISPSFSLPGSKKSINELLNVLKDSLKVVKLQT